MTYKIKGEAEVQLGFGLPRHTTATRTAYTPPSKGYQVFDTELDKVFTWDGSTWDSGAEATDLSNYVTLDGTETITGAKTFTDSVLVAPTSGNPLIELQRAGSLNSDLFTSVSSGVIIRKGAESGTTATEIKLTTANIQINKPLELGYTPTDASHAVRVDYVETHFVDKVNTQTIGGDKTFTGNTLVKGSFATDDPIIFLNSAEQGVEAGTTSGIEVSRGFGENQQLIWDDVDDKWKFGPAGGTLLPIASESYVDNAGYMVDTGDTMTGTLLMNDADINIRNNGGSTPKLIFSEVATSNAFEASLTGGTFELRHNAGFYGMLQMSSNIASLSAGLDANRAEILIKHPGTGEFIFNNNGVEVLSLDGTGPWISTRKFRSAATLDNDVDTTLTTKAWVLGKIPAAVDTAGFVDTTTDQTIAGIKTFDGTGLGNYDAPIEITANDAAHFGVGMKILRTSTSSETLIRMEEEPVTFATPLAGGLGMGAGGKVVLIGGMQASDDTFASPVSEIGLGATSDGITIKNYYDSKTAQLKVTALSGFSFTCSGSNKVVSFGNLRATSTFTNGVGNPAGTLARVDYVHANFMGTDTIDNLDDVDISTAAPAIGQTLVWTTAGGNGHFVPGDIPSTSAFVNLTSDQTITGAKTFDGSGLIGNQIPVHIISNDATHDGVALKITQSSSTSESVIRIEEPAASGAKAGIIGLRNGELTLIGGVDANDSGGTDFPPTKIDLGVNNILLKHSGSDNAELQIAGWMGFNFSSTNASATANFNSMPVQTYYEHGAYDAPGTLVRKDYVEANFAQGTIPTNADYVDLTTPQTVAGDKTFSGDTIMSGNLTVNGTVTTVNSNNVNIADSIITLNSDETGTPSANGGIEIERGNATNVQLVWNENTDRWQTGLVGSLVDLVTATDVAARSAVVPFVSGDWTTGALTITQATHGVELSDTYHVTAYEGTDVVVVGVSVHASNGSVTLSIDSAAFAGRVRISV